MSIKIVLLMVLILAPAALAADWVEVSVRHSWDRKSVGFCSETSQCLVSNAFSEAWDNFPERYWSETTNANKPKCINHTQYIGDNYCEMGSWSSRTKLVATQLLALSLNLSPTNFSLYCDSYDSVLNKYSYNTDYGAVTTFLSKFCLQPGNKRVENCVNNICVMRYGQGVAFGMAINTDIGGAKSPLQALNLSNSACDSAKNNDNDYDPCGFGVWYDDSTQSILYAPGVNPLPAPIPLVQSFFMTPYNKLKNYVFTVVHKPDIQQYNYTFFRVLPQFNQVYMAKEDFDFVYSFRQGNVTLQQIDYAGWYFSNIAMPNDACSRIIKGYDGRANCEQQPTETEFYIAAHKTPPVNKLDIRQSIVDAWQEMAKIRVSP